MHEPLRVAFFACTYNEVDGVATTSRQFEAFARRRDLPMLSLHGGDSEYFGQKDGSVVRCEYRRRWPTFALDRHHNFDLGFWRYYSQIEKAVRTFGPDVIHITGPSDVGQIGTLAAHRLGIPLAASWHTNIHEYLERRLQFALSMAPSTLRNRIIKCARGLSLRLTARFYHIARVLFAPNREVVDLLSKYTGKRVHLMTRGVDTNLFRPPTRQADPAREFTIGYVGRLTPEKNVRFLDVLEKRLLERGYARFRLLLIGEGGEEAWLRANLKHAVFKGVLRGETLAAAYREMDVFAFPSRTDTYGNVVQEAAASGVPSVVTDGGGPKFIVAHGKTGLVAADETQFIDHVASLIESAELLNRMRVAAREQAMHASWDAVFDRVYSVYRQTILAAVPESRIVGEPVEA